MHLSVVHVPKYYKVVFVSGLVYYCSYCSCRPSFCLADFISDFATFYNISEEDIKSVTLLSKCHSGSVRISCYE